MTIPASWPDPHARGRATERPVAAGGLAGEEARSLPGGGELVQLAASERGNPRAGAEAAASPLEGPGGTSAAARRLRLASPTQLELVSAGERPRPEVVWASLPERSREQVLLLLARLIDSGAVEEDGA
jgi:hypothetical protein